ncbi:hypothetical protein [Siccirubricoccus soli]|nr:hypothetical protein [Siccirubricoccus soli]
MAGARSDNTRALIENRALLPAKAGFWQEAMTQLRKYAPEIAEAR